MREALAHPAQHAPQRARRRLGDTVAQVVERGRVVMDVEVAVVQGGGGGIVLQLARGDLDLQQQPHLAAAVAVQHHLERVDRRGELLGDVGPQLGQGAVQRGGGGGIGPHRLPHRVGDEVPADVDDRVDDLVDAVLAPFLVEGELLEDQAQRPGRGMPDHRIAHPRDRPRTVVPDHVPADPSACSAHGERITPLAHGNLNSVMF